MAMPVQPQLIGVDVSKRELVICTDPDQALITLANEPQAIGPWLDTWPTGSLELAVEATNTFHLELIEQAHRRGHTAYLVDGYRLSRYRDSVGTRAKTDAHDARLLWRYLAHERRALRPWTPPPAGYRPIQQLLHRRALVVKSKVALEQSLGEVPELQSALAALRRQLAHLATQLQRRITAAARAQGWRGELARCQAIEGVGALTAAALVTTYHRGAFRHGDAFIAFIGLDVRARDSGQSRGRRRLTKQGDPELRRLLYLAAMQACRQPSWREFYQRHLARGLTKTQALVALARKLARVAFALLRHQTDYQPKIPQEAGMQT